MCRRNPILCFTVACGWFQCEFPLREQAAGGFVKLGGAADDCRYPVVSALLFIAAAGIPLCLSHSLGFRLTVTKKKKRLGSYPLLETNTKRIRHKLQYVSGYYMKQNGRQTGAHSRRSLPLYLLCIQPPVPFSSIPALFYFTFLWKWSVTSSIEMLNEEKSIHTDRFSHQPRWINSSQRAQEIAACW